MWAPSVPSLALAPVHLVGVWRHEAMEMALAEYATARHGRLNITGKWNMTGYHCNGSSAISHSQ